MPETGGRSDNNEHINTKDTSKDEEVKTNGTNNDSSTTSDSSNNSEDSLKNKEHNNNQDKSSEDTEDKDESASKEDQPNSSESHSRGGLRDKLNTAKDKVKNAPKNAVDSVKNAPKNAANKIKHNASEAGKKLKNIGKNKATEVKANVRHAKEQFQKKTVAGQIMKARANGAKGVSAIGKGLKNRVVESEKFQQIFEKAKKVIKFIVNHIRLIGILSAIAGIVIPFTFLIIGYAQTLDESPHYYCDINADASIKRTAVYQQYCSELKNFAFDDIDGHYLVQDGSGPCLATAKINLALRFYTSQGINFYDYLFQQDGKYLPTAKNVTSDGSNGIERTIRAAANNGSTSNNKNTRNYTLKYTLDVPGYKWFAQQHGQNNVDMANWGFCADSGINLNEWENTDTPIDLTHNENWLWDLSLSSTSRGSAWGGIGFSVNMNIENIPCTFEPYEDFSKNSTEYGSAGSKGKGPVGEYVKDALDQYKFAAGCMPGEEPGVLFYYCQPNGGHHAILITRYEENPDGTTTWYIVDSGKGMSGGFEGPITLKGTYNISTHAAGLLDLLNYGDRGNGFELQQLYIVSPDCYGKVLLNNLMNN